MNKYFLYIVMALLMLFSVSAIDITAPLTITTGGSYDVVNDFSGDIIVHADDVILNINGYTVTGIVQIDQSIDNFEMSNFGVIGLIVSVSSSNFNIHDGNMAFAINNLDNFFFNNVSTTNFVMTNVSNGVINNFSTIGTSFSDSKNIIFSNGYASTNIIFNPPLNTNITFVNITSLSTTLSSVTNPSFYNFTAIGTGGIAMSFNNVVNAYFENSDIRSSHLGAIFPWQYISSSINSSSNNNIGWFPKYISSDIVTPWDIIYYNYSGGYDFLLYNSVPTLLPNPYYKTFYNEFPIPVVHYTFDNNVSSSIAPLGEYFVLNDTEGNTPTFVADVPYLPSSSNVNSMHMEGLSWIRDIGTERRFPVNYEDDFTQSGWIKFNEIDGFQHALFGSKSTESGNWFDFSFGLRLDGSITYVSRSTVDSGWECEIIDSNDINITVGEWYFLSATHDASTNTDSFSINNELFSHEYDCAGASAGADTFVGNGNYKDFLISDWEVYDTILASNEINDLKVFGEIGYRTPVSTPSLDSPCGQNITISESGVNVIFNFTDNSYYTPINTYNHTLSNALQSFSLGVNQEESLNISLSSLNYNSGLYTYEVVSTNDVGTTASNDCSFTICINDYSQVIGDCLENSSQLITYTDNNNCNEQYDLPIDSNTYQSCSYTSPPTTNSTSIMSISLMLLFIVVVLIVLWYVTKSYIVGSVATLYTVLVSFYVKSSYNDNIVFLGFVFIGFVMLFILLFSLIKKE